MDAMTSLHERSLAEELAPLDAPAAVRDSVVADPMLPDAYRLAFADPEFMARREARGIRFQLECYASGEPARVMEAFLARRRSNHP